MAGLFDDPGQPLETEVLIVGGSLVGLSAACFLGAQGVRPLVIEKHAGTSIHPRAGYFHVGTMESYRRIGLEPAILQASHEQFGPDGGINLVESLAGRELALFVPSINLGLEPFSPCKRFFITQQSLEPLLHRRASELGAELHYRSELVDFAQDETGVTAQVRDVDGGETRTIRARYMIAADGNRSPIRQKLGIGMSGPGWLSDSISIYFKADCSQWLERRPMGVIYVANPDQRGFFRFAADGKSGFLVVNTLGDPLVPGAKDVAADVSRERCVALVRSAIGVPDIAVEIEDVATWKAEAICADAYRAGRVFLAGDAAHVVPPTGGFGGNTGVQDAGNLAWKLAKVVKGEAGEALLDSYEAERRPVGLLTVEQAYTRYMRRVTPEEVTPETPAQRDELTMELGQFYRSGAVVDGRGEGQPACLHPRETRGAPGSRLPYASLGTDQTTVDAVADGMALLAGPDFADWPELDAEGLASFVLPPQALHRFGIGPSGALLARPDGFIAARAREASAETVRGWLAHTLAR